MAGCGVAYNFKTWDRDQLMLLPPDISAWLPQDHLALFVLDAVDQLDLSPVLDRRRADGWGRAAYHPQMMVSLLVYAYCLGEMSSRAIERACRDELPFRVICANQVPDHTTICRFRQDFAGEVVGLFVQVLMLCHRAGLAELGTLALDGTKIAGDAALSANRTYARLDEEFTETVAALLAAADEVDAAEDARFGTHRRGDELPEELADPTSRVARLAAAKQQLEEAKQAEQDAYQQHLAERAAKEAERGRKLRGRKPKDPGVVPDADARANVTDPESRIMKDGRGRWVQGYNAQAIVNDQQIVLAADLTQDANDVNQLHPMLQRLDETLAAAGIDGQPGTVLADAGYCSETNLEQADPDGPQMLVATTSRHKLGDAATDNQDDDTDDDTDDGEDDEGQLSLVEQMARRLATDDDARDRYGQRGWMVEGVFGQVKAPRGIRTLGRRGLAACKAEWLMILACHNLLKLWRHGRGGRGGDGQHGPDGGFAPDPTSRTALAGRLALAC